MLACLCMGAGVAHAQCHDDEVLVGEDRDNYYCKKVTLKRGFDTHDRSGSEKETLKRALRDIGNGPPEKWILENVSFDRVSRGPNDVSAGVRPGTVTLYDPFFAEAASAEYQENVLIFELGKAVWFGRINSGPREEPTRMQQEFSGLVQKHAAVVAALKYASLRGEDLSALTDTDAGGDLQSQFAAAFRVVLLGLDLPTGNPNPSSFSDAEWQNIRRKWPQARKELKRYVEDTFAD